MGAKETAGASAAEAEDLIAGLAAPEAAADPYPVYARLRELGPAHRVTSGAVFVTGYSDCAAVTRDTHFASQSPEWLDRVMPGWRRRPANVATFEAMLFRDPPVHTRLRRLVAGTFAPRRVDAMRAEVAGLTDRALDRLADAGAGGAAVNLHQVLADSLPVSVIGTLVGVPAADWPGLQTSISALLDIVELAAGPEQFERADAAAETLHGYFTGLAADRRAAPRDDLASALVRAAGPGGETEVCGAGSGETGHSETGTTAAGNGEVAAGLGQRELVQMLTFLFMAGVDTMINMLANGSAALLAHPAQAQRLRAEPRLGPAAVEEILRYDAPVQFVGRVATRKVRVGDVTVPADGQVIAMLGSANRDPARFADPDRFDITRTGTTALSFGGGIHHCLGAPLARLEAGAFFPALLHRFPGLRSAGAPQRRGLVFRGFSDLPVALG